MLKKAQIITSIIVLGVVLGALLWEPVLKGLFVKKPLIEKLIVGTDATYRPMEYFDDAGNFTGMDIDIAKEIASDLGAEIEFRNLAWEGIFDTLQAGEVQMLISSITITPERAQTMDFSNPYFNAGQVVVTTADKAAGIGGVEDLDGKKVGAQVKTTSEVEAKKSTDPSLVKSFADNDLAKSALLNGVIDAIITDYPAAIGMVSGEATLRIIGEPFTQEFYGVAVKKGEEKLLAEINKTIRRLKEEGKLRELEQEWLSPATE